MCGPRRTYIPNGLESVKPSLDLITDYCKTIASLVLANLFQRREKEGIPFSMLSTLLKFNIKTTL